MLGINTNWEDTIVALATPPGVGAIGVIRVSGVKAIPVIDEMFGSKELSTQPSHTIHVGYLKDGGQKLDEVVISLFKKPHSYTGEDVVEISCHGSTFVQQEIINAISKRDVRLAKPGEFTQRAFLNGKLDLIQAEAVGDLIASNTSASRNAAINNIRGGFSTILRDLREQLIQFSSLIELELDFSEEDVEFADRTKFITLVSSAISTVSRLAGSFRLGNVIKNGVNTAIVGKPNAGKSTLLNVLLNDERAIVSEIAGTTRDTIEEILNINGILFRLIDTAGIREHTHDEIESKGIIKSHEKIAQADIVLYVFDVSQMPPAELVSISDQFRSLNKRLILIGNKSDKGNFNFDGLEVIYLSAKNNQGLNSLKEKLFSLATLNESLSENVIITNSRHLESLQNIKNALEQVQSGLVSNISGDLLAIEINQALHFLGELTGEISNEDRLDYIFSKFCIGK